MEHKNENVHIPRVGSGKKEVRVKNVKVDVVETLQNIASHLGIDVSAMLRSKFKEIIESYPEHYRKPYED